MDLEGEVVAYLEGLREDRRLLPSSLRLYERELESLCRLWKKAGVGAVLEQLRPLSPATARRKLLIWKAFGRARGLDLNLPERLPRLRESLPRYLSEEEIFRLESACYRSSQVRRNRLLVALGLELGLRLSEILGLRFADLEGNWILVRRKGGKEQRLPLSPSLLSHLTAWKRESGGGLSDYVFPGRGAGPLSPRAAQKIFENLGKAARIENLHPHCLRHSFASRLAARGASLVALKELLGHRSIATTERYLHASPEHLRETLGLLTPLASAGKSLNSPLGSAP